MRWIPSATAAALLLLLGAACTQQVSVSKSAAPPETPVRAVSRVEDLQEAFTRVAETATMSVVSIQSTQLAGPAESRLGLGLGFGLDRRVRNIGSGFVYGTQGIILTNDHVVSGSKQIRVTFAGGRTLEAKVIGSDKLTDLAVLKVEETGLPVLPFETKIKPRLGQIVIAVGSPFGLSGSVTTGVISAVGRKDMGLQRYEQFIQTDAAINEGNSGGPLLDLSGRVIGINTAIVAGGTGVGFAIPADMAVEVAERLLSAGHVSRGYLGVQIQELDENLRAYFGLPGDARGVLINVAIASGPAQKAGLREGDVLTKFDDTAILSVTQLQNVVAHATPGSTHQLSVWRDRKSFVVPIALEGMPNEPAEAPPEEEPKSDRLGLNILEINTPGESQKNARPILMISSIAIGSPAEKSGLAVSDVIVAIEGKAVKNKVGYDGVVSGLPKGAMALFVVERTGVKLQYAVQAP